MSNGNTLPWVIALVASIVGAGAVGFVGGRYTAEPAPAPVVTAQAPGQPAAPNGQTAPQDPNALPPGMTTEPSGDWTLVCQEKDGHKGCGATQSVMNDQKQTILGALAIYDPNNGQKLVVFSTPLRVDLAAGLEFNMPGKGTVKLPYATCNAVVCQAGLTIADDDYAALDKQGNLEVAYLRGDGVKTPIKVSMKGLTDAYAKMPKPTPPAPGSAAAPAAPDATQPPAGKPAKQPKPAKPNGG